MWGVEDTDDATPISDNLIATVILLKCISKDNLDCKDADRETISSILERVKSAESEYDGLEKLISRLVDKYPILMSVLNDCYTLFDQNKNAKVHKPILDKGFIFNVIALASIDESNQINYSINPGIIDTINQIRATGA